MIVLHSDTDRDGVSDYDEVMNPDIYDPLNPDSDGDSLVDSMDPQPGIFNDPTAVDPVDGYTLGFKVAHLGPAGAVMNFTTDSDGDGFEDWRELLAGTLINDYNSRPVAADGIPTLFSATITLAAALPEPVLLTLGGRRVMLREAGSTKLWLNEGVANTLSLCSVNGCDVAGLSITIDSPYAAYVGDDKPFNGIVRLRSGEQTGFGMVVQPIVSTASNWLCFHDEPTRIAHASVLPENCPGYPHWAEYGSSFTIDGSDSMSAILAWYGAPGCDDLYFEYYLPGAAYRRAAYVHITRCAAHGSTTSSESSSAAVAVNNDDDDGNETDDRNDSTVEDENDLHQSRPIYGYGESCCPCYGYGPNPDIIATRTYCSGNLRTYTSPSKVSEKTKAFPGDSVFVEGRAASPTVGAEKILWSWTEEGEAKASTNYYTVFSVRLFGDLDFDDDVDAVDRAAVTNLTEQYGWAMLVASNTLRKVELKTDVLIPGYRILSLSGDAQIRVWKTPNPTINDTPLLITGQTVTNGFDGAGFGAYPTSMLYVEALDSGVATLTYSYVGTGAAEGFGCSAEVHISTCDYQKISLGRTAVFDSFTVGKVYIPTKWGGTLTLYNCDLDLYFTDGSDLTGEIAEKILNGQFESYLVAEGSPCEYIVPTNTFKWFYFKVDSSQHVTVSNSFVQSKTVSKTPWTCPWYPMADEQSPNLYEEGRCLHMYDTAYGTAARDIELNNWIRVVDHGHFLNSNLIVRADMERTFGFDFNNADGDNNVRTGWDANICMPQFWPNTFGDSEQDVSWFGHCDIATAVIICEDEPTGNYNAPNSVTFTPALKKDLLVALYHGFEYAAPFSDYDILPHVWHKNLELFIIGDDKMFGCDIFNSDAANEMIWNYPIFSISEAKYFEVSEQTDEKEVEVICEVKYWNGSEAKLYYWYCVTYDADGVALYSDGDDWKEHPSADDNNKRPDSVWIPAIKSSVDTYWNGQLNYSIAREIISIQ